MDYLLLLKRIVGHELYEQNAVYKVNIRYHHKLLLKIEFL
jgi:hypothetical protein